MQFHHSPGLLFCPQHKDWSLIIRIATCCRYYAEHRCRKEQSRRET